MNNALAPRCGDPATRELARPQLDGEIQSYLDRGDVAGALHHVMERYGHSVYNFCCVVLGDRVLAEDVQQQTFLEAFRDLPRFQHRCSVRSWIFSIARHRVYDALKVRRRAEARTSPGDITDELAEEPDPRPQPDESIDARRLRAALVASLRELREPVMIAVVLRFHQGFTFEEIAEVCGDSAGTHHARVTRALRQLRVRIESRIQQPPPAASRWCSSENEYSLRSLMVCAGGATRKMPTSAGKSST